MPLHAYQVSLAWTSTLGTLSYRSYSRDFHIGKLGGASILGSADPAFRGNDALYNPEELFLSSVASCHMLWYLHLCADAQIIVKMYHDTPSAEMIENADGSGQFSAIHLRPKVTISSTLDEKKAIALHQQAHRMCFIARSIHTPINITPQIVWE